MYEFEPEWLEKLEALRASGVEPYPNGLEVTHTSTDLHQSFGAVEDPSAAEGATDIAIGGRVIFRNRMGRAMFLRLQDRGLPEVDDVDEEGNAIKRGGMIQVYLRQDAVGEEVFELLKKTDIGDFLWVRGSLMRTRTGELTLRGQEARLAGKILNAFPDRWHSVTDVQTRSRQRYVDLFMNAESREVFRKRFTIIRHIRNFMEAREYLEVETPMMQVLPGGAAARPFITHHNTLDLDLYLRIAPELYLKRLVVGGFERVFEINRSFRNEGVSVKHNPEFTMLEFYQAWATYEDLIVLVEELLSELALAICGDTKVAFGDMTIDFTAPFRRADMDELIAEYAGVDREVLQTAEGMEAWWRASREVAADATLPPSRGKWWEFLFDEYVEDKLINPTFVTGFPTEISPLSRRNDEDPSRVDRFELVVAGWELVNAFSELNDPVDQAQRFADQVAARAAGDEESMYFDKDYIRALTYGMPPTAGAGLGIDRLVMLLTGRRNIREVILFPTLRPENPS
jgi:lysyl-tRNA synthetase, class II